MGLQLNTDQNPCFVRMEFIYFGGQGTEKKGEYAKYNALPVVKKSGVKRVSKCEG